MPALFPIIMNSTNAVPDNPSTYVYKFPRGSIQLRKASVALSQINLYYSWGNISKASYNNSEFKIIFPDGTPATFTEYNVVIPDGNYTVEDLNKYLQAWAVTNKKYLINNTTGNYMYFMELLANPQTYKIQLIVYPIPTSMPAGYSHPTGGFFSFPIAAGQEPSLVVLPSPYNFGKLIGFSPGPWFDHESDITPQMSPVSSVLVRCSLINNKFTNPNDVIYSFVSGSTEYGRMLSVNSQDLVYAPIDDGLYTEVIVRFVDNNFQRLNIVDTNLIIYLIVKIED